MQLKTKVAFLVSTAIISFSSSVYSANPAQKQLITESIKQLEQTKLSNWYYKLDTYETDGGEPTTFLEEHDPTRPAEERWQILQWNGKAPTSRKLKSYRESKIESLKKQDGDDDGLGINLNKLIDFSSLRFKKQSGDVMLFSFKANMDDMGEDGKGKFDGLLHYSTSEKFIKEIEIVNNDDFSPEFVASIDKFKLTYQFQKSNGFILPVELKTKVEGSLGLIISFDDDSSEKFTDFKLVKK